VATGNSNKQQKAKTRPPNWPNGIPAGPRNKQKKAKKQNLQIANWGRWLAGYWLIMANGC
jgi:hypothetical protein